MAMRFTNNIKMHNEYHVDGILAALYFMQFEQIMLR